MEKPISFKLSDGAASYAEHLLNAPEIPSEISTILANASKDKLMDLPEMIKIFEWRCEKYKADKEEEDHYSAYPLLQDAAMVLPNLPENEPNPELVERRKRLSAQQENRKYNKMVENLSKKETSTPKKRQKSAIISGFNFALTLFGSCGACVYLLQNVVPDLAFRAGIGMAVGTIILVIEIYLAVREIERQEKKSK